MNEKEDTLLETAAKIFTMAKGWLKGESAITMFDEEDSKITDGSGNIAVNGCRYNGKVMSVRHDRIIIDGKVINPGSNTITIDIYGDIEILTVDACEYVKVSGNAGRISTMSGDVYCGNVNSSVVTASGNVTCEDITGNIETMSGNIKRKNGPFNKC